MLCSAWGSVAVVAEPADESVDTDRLGYFFGYYFGNLLKEQGSVDIDLDELRQGISDAVAGRTSALKPQEQKRLMAVIGNRRAAIQKAKQQAQQEKQQAQEEKQQAAQQAAQGYLAENASKGGINVTASGLQYEVLTSGSGKSPTATGEVVVHYRGQLVDGKEFDSSYKRNKPAEFRLNQVIPGWTEGLQLMNKGAKYRFYVPPELGYGAGGVASAGIPPNAVLIFDVELLEIK